MVKVISKNGFFEYLSPFNSYIYIERGVRMNLDNALSIIQKCQVPKLKSYSTLQEIKHEEFYYPSPLIKTRADDNSKVILFSAPGAVGKTVLAKHIAYHYGGLYWNVASKPVGGTSFAGEIAHAVGVGNGAQQDDLYRKLNCGESIFVLDSFDEAALISRRDGIKDFLCEIGEILADATSPSIVLTARTEMSRFICDTCDEIGLPLTCFDIDYFEENEAPLFIGKYLEHKGIRVNQKQERSIEAYLEEIKLHLGTKINRKSFIGYAQVLSILARQVEMEYITEASLDNLVSLVQPQEDDCLIYDIIQQLILREQSKLENFRNSIREKYIPFHKEHVVDMLYCKEEQLIRLQFFVAAQSIDTIAIDDYPNCSDLFPEDQVEYLTLLKDWLPQHVFLYEHDVLPVFSDYLLAESLLNSNLELFAEEYQSKLPTRVFMDCYLSLNNGAVNSEHIYYLDLAFSSQAGTQSTAYCDISSIDEEDNPLSDSDENLSLYLTLTTDDGNSDLDVFAKIHRVAYAPICLCRAENMSVSVDGKVILSPSFLGNVTIREASIECDDLELDAPEVFFETYGSEENHIIVHKAMSRKPGGKITIKGTQKLRIQLPDKNRDEYKRQFYEFMPYVCSITDDEDTKCCDKIEQFVHALKKVLEQFKVDKYDGDPAKYKEKIDARCHSGCKARVLNFLKYTGLIYEDGIIYKASLKKMDELHISRVAYNHFDYVQLQYAYNLYSEWFAKAVATSTLYS